MNLLGHRTVGYEVIEADCCKDALMAFKGNRNSIDFLVADVSLPDGNGCELAIALKRLQPELRVLFISGHVGAEVCRFYGLDVNDSHYLRKPFEPADLLQHVGRVLSEVGFPPLLATNVG
jgi:DNA-binding response OmpR family regulator